MYRIWCKAKGGTGVGFWSDSYPEKYADLSSAQSVVDKINSEECHLNTYEVARVNEDGGPNFFDIKDPVEDLEPLTDSEDFDLDEPIPYTLRSQEQMAGRLVRGSEQPSEVSYQTIIFGFDPAMPDSEPSPDAKRFVTIEDLRATANKVTEQTHTWKIGKGEISGDPLVHVASTYGRTFLNGCLLMPEEVSALIVALSDALKATAA